MENKVLNQNLSDSNNSASPLYSIKLFLGFFIAAVFIGAGGAYQSFQYNKEMKNLSEKYQVLGSDDLLVTKGFSVKQNMMLKIKILSGLNPRPEILFVGNHQLQYFGTSFSNTVSPSKFFNLWLGNLGITEIADITSYLDRASLIPRKALIVMITTPNNDNGECIVGYKGELPDKMYQLHKRGKNIGLLSEIQDSWHLGTISYELDYKKIMGLVNGLSIEIAPSTKRIVSHFMILKNGASAHHDDNYWNSPPIMNENPLDDKKSHIKPHDIKEIGNSIKYIDGVAKSNDIQAIVIIPPVHESMGRSSFADRVLSQALEGLSLSHTKIIDHRQIPEKTDPTFFFRYDHPSSKYGKQLYDEISSVLATTNDRAETAHMKK
jgi:hypothetical protein